MVVRAGARWGARLVGHAVTARRAALLVGPLALVAIEPAAGAVRVRSPLETLALPEHQVARLAAVGVEDEGRYRFRRLEATPEEPEDLVLRVPAAVEAELEPGAAYLAGYSEIVPVPRARRTFRRDPAGPRLLELEGVGPALFADDPALRALLVPAPEAPPDAAAQVAALGELLGRDDARLRRLAASELALRADLWPAATAATESALAGAFAAAGDDLYTRYRALEAAAGIAPSGPAAPASWLPEACREVLDGAPIELELGSYHPILLLTALEALARHGEAADAARVERHLDSSSSGVGKAALAALEALAPECAPAAAAAALARGALHAETRRAVEAFLARRGPDSG